MSGKIAVKRLTASDLTLFAYQFRNFPAGKQKAININANILIDELYPALKSNTASIPQRFPIDLYLYGPSYGNELNLQRKILKQEKNWRLDGELVYNPEEEPDRFNLLAPGDFAIFEFNEGVYPDTIKINLLANAAIGDKGLHFEFDSLLATEKMIIISSKKLEQIISQANPDQKHPIYNFIGDADIEDIALGGSQARERILSKPSRRKMSAEEFLRTKANIDRVGLLGEQFVNDYLSKLLEEGKINSFEWVSRSNVINPYDFWLSYDGVAKIFLDVKSTEGEFQRILHVSYSELKQMSIETEQYDIYRIYNIEDSTAQLQVCENMKNFATNILNTLNTLPQGVASDSISFSPNLLSFNSPITIELNQQSAE